jgi:hypothetical protein
MATVAARFNAVVERNSSHHLWLGSTDPASCLTHRPASSTRAPSSTWALRYGAPTADATRASHSPARSIQRSAAGCGSSRNALAANSPAPGPGATF